MELWSYGVSCCLCFHQPKTLSRFQNDFTQSNCFVCLKEKNAHLKKPLLLEQCLVQFWEIRFHLEYVKQNKLLGLVWLGNEALIVCQ